MISNENKRYINILNFRKKATGVINIVNLQDN
jgi:hypothetical protein